MWISYSYISSSEHLFGQILAIPLVAVCGTTFPSREDILKVRLQKAFVSEICQLDIWICGNFVIDVKVVVSVLIQEQAPERGTVSNVDNLVQFLW